MNELSKTELKTLTTIRAKFKKGIADYQLIANDDHILIGLSGGKDSLALVQLLGERMRIFVPRFKVTAAHISVENISYQSDLSYLKAHCEKYGIELIHKTVGFDMEQDPGKSTCFLCSWHRRKTLFDIAKELGCNKLALGHHLDDITETLMLNMVYQGAIATMPPKLKMDKFDMTIIRPLCLLTEKEMKELERIENYQQQIKNCPYEKDSSRSDAKKLISDLEKWNPDIRQSLWAAMQNVKQDYLPQKLSFKK
ncbi:MAG: tRNA 2-thiocytidine biosynthesis protein TtcA [Paludibacter sp.]|nr:tRNA 2-thiocytidine biosynthesis protein TtcA [Paludibacter sp.]